MSNSESARLLFTGTQLFGPVHVWQPGWLLTEGRHIRLLGPGQPPAFPPGYVTRRVGCAGRILAAGVYRPAFPRRPGPRGDGCHPRSPAYHGPVRRSTRSHSVPAVELDGLPRGDRRDAGRRGRATRPATGWGDDCRRPPRRPLPEPGEMRRPGPAVQSGVRTWRKRTSGSRPAWCACWRWRRNIRRTRG